MDNDERKMDKLAVKAGMRDSSGDGYERRRKASAEIEEALRDGKTANDSALRQGVADVRDAIQGMLEGREGDVSGGPHSHVEAFCLMQYVSEDYLETETLWNSRDGVTPFIISNRDRTKKMQHGNWTADTCVDIFIPPIGTRIFVDMAKEKLLETKQRFVELWWDAGEDPMKEHTILGPLGKEGAAHRLCESEWREGMPEIVVVTEEMFKEFTEKAAG